MIVLFSQATSEVKITAKGKQQQAQAQQKSKVQASGTDGESSANEAAPSKHQEKTTEVQKTKIARQSAKENVVERKKKTKRTDKSESENEENATMVSKASDLLSIVAAATVTQGRARKDRSEQVLGNVTSTLASESLHLMEQAEHVAENVATAVTEQGRALMDKAQHLIESLPTPSEALSAVAPAGKAGKENKKAKKTETTVNTVNEQQANNGLKEENKQETVQRRKDKPTSISDGAAKKEQKISTVGTSGGGGNFRYRCLQSLVIMIYECPIKLILDFPQIIVRCKKSMISLETEPVIY